MSSGTYIPVGRIGGDQHASAALSWALGPEDVDGLSSANS